MLITFDKTMDTTAAPTPGQLNTWWNGAPVPTIAVQWSGQTLQVDIIGPGVPGPRPLNLSPVELAHHLDHWETSQNFFPQNLQLKLGKAVIRSITGTNCKVRYGDKLTELYIPKGGSIDFE